MEHRWDETWFRLREWTNASAQAERLSAQILSQEGFTSVDPSHPLGGPDGKKDAVCSLDGERWIMATYFPRGQQDFSKIRSKFLSDAEGVAENSAVGMAFVTNQEVTVSERRQLENAVSCKVEVFHLERVAAILDRPPMAPVRKQFLGIEFGPRTDVTAMRLILQAVLLDTGWTFEESVLLHICFTLSNPGESTDLESVGLYCNGAPLAEVLEDLASVTLQRAGCSLPSKPDWFGESAEWLTRAHRIERGQSKWLVAPLIIEVSEQTQDLTALRVSAESTVDLSEPFTFLIRPTIGQEVSAPIVCIKKTAVPAATPVVAPAGAWSEPDDRPIRQRLAEENAPFRAQIQLEAEERRRDFFKY